MKTYSLNIKTLFNFVFLFKIITNSKVFEPFLLDVTKSSISIMYINNSSIVDYFDERSFEYPEKQEEEEKDITPFIVNILTIDCEAKIEVPDGINAKKISHNNYNAYSIYFNTYMNFFLYPLIKSTTEINGNYPLITTCIKMDKSNIPELNMIENQPVFLYFSDILKEINLVYNFKQNYNEHPIIVSFYIQEKVNFKIKISDNKNKIIIEKIINYKENIEFKPETDKIYNIFILQKKV